MNVRPTRHIVLRDRLLWEASAVGLRPVADGTLTLLPLPLPEEPLASAGPYAVPPSGLACAPCHSLFAADTAAHQVVYEDGACGHSARLPGVSAPGPGIGELHTPRGLAFRSSRGLYVADSGNGRIVLLRDPSLEPSVVVGGLTGPTALAIDSSGRLTVLDTPGGRVLRFSAAGAPDSAYDAAMAAHGIVAAFLALDAADVLYLSSATGELLRFAADATPLPWASAPAWLTAGAIAIDGDRVYAADTQTGLIEVLDPATGARLGTIRDYRGPVAALAVCDGDLLVKPGDDATVLRFCAGGAYTGLGTLTAGPFDAGEKDAWFEASVDAEVPPATSVRLAVYVDDDPTIPPGPGDWMESPAPALLVRNLFPSSGRYLWLRVVLESADGVATPRLRQVRAQTPGEDYLDHLPELYRRADAGHRLLERMLALLRAQFDSSQRILSDLPYRLAVDFAREEDLPWLAGWLGFELPRGIAHAQARALLHRVAALYDRRCTPAGLAEMVHVYTGARPKIVEAFRERRLWRLGVDSRLAFDTALAPADPVGLVVADSSLLAQADPPYDCAVPDRITIGSARVGAGGPLDEDDLGLPLFEPAAHRFRVVVPAHQAPEPERRDAIRAVIEAEKPAHTAYELCIVEPRLRVGLQARVGIDAIVAGLPQGSSLAVTLDQDAYLAAAGPGSRVGSQSQVGLTTVLA